MNLYNANIRISVKTDYNMPIRAGSNMYVGNFVALDPRNAAGVAYRRAYAMLSSTDRLGDEEGIEHFRLWQV